MEKTQDKNIENNDNKDTGGMDQDYLKVIQDLKKSTVERREYEKLLEENKKLLNTIVGTSGTPTESAKPEPVDIQALRTKLTTTEMTNLEYVQTALKLREALIAKGEPDPFLPIGKKVSPTAIDFEKAEQVADVLNECVEKSQGNPTDFTIALKGRIRDDVSKQRNSKATAGRIIN